MSSRSTPRFAPRRRGVATSLAGPVAAALVVLAAVLAPRHAGVARADGAPGALDPSFGRDGKVVLGFAPDGSFGVDLAVQPDGRVVVLGTNFQPDSAVFLARLLPDGTLDRSFGKHGKVRFGSAAGGMARGSALALQPDGRIVVSALVERGDRTHHLRSMTLVARLLPDGSFDRSFGGNGRATFTFDGLYLFPDSVLVTRSGKVVVGGPGYPHGDFSSAGGFITLARLTSDGKLDRTFGDRGRLRIGPALGGAWGLAEQADGKLVVGGQPGLRRLLDDGALDPSFGDGGIVTTVRSSDDATAIAAIVLDPLGRILTVGSNWYTNQNVVLTRHLADGAFDPSFGDGGRVVTDYRGNADGGTALAIAPDGRIVVAGSVGVRKGGASSRRFAVLRYLPDGTLDPSFAAGGIAMIPLVAGNPWGESWAAGVAVHDGRILACGKSGGRRQRTVVTSLLP